jgi:hypothetical protein
MAGVDCADCIDRAYGYLLRDIVESYHKIKLATIMIILS